MYLSIHKKLLELICVFDLNVGGNSAQATHPVFIEELMILKKLIKNKTLTLSSLHISYGLHAMFCFKMGSFVRPIFHLLHVIHELYALRSLMKILLQKVVIPCKSNMEGKSMNYMVLF